MNEQVFYIAVAATFWVLGAVFALAGAKYRERRIRDSYRAAVAKASLWDRIYIKDEAHLNNFCLNHAPGGPQEKVDEQWFDFKRDAREYWPGGGPR